MAHIKSALKRVCVVQPILSNYSLPVFLELAQHCEVDLFFSLAPKESGFGEISLPSVPNIRYFPVATWKPFGDRIGMFQRGLVGYILRQRPDAIFLSANLREFSFWCAAFCGWMLGILVYAHGHGPFKKKTISVLYRVMMQALLRMLTSYICYAPIVQQSFVDYGFDPGKLSVAHNSLINLDMVRPEEKKGDEKGILFVGRLRKNNQLQLLIRVITRIRDTDGLPLSLHVIGTGEEAARLREEARNCPWIVFYGGVYDFSRIRDVSLNCFLGCYPGNAGLSVEHMMSLSLAVITHDDLQAHAGPEPSFIRNGASGLLYDHADPEPSLYQAIRSLACDPEKLAKMQKEAFAEYCNLVTPSLAERFWQILRESGKQHRDSTVGEVAPYVESSAGARTEGGHS
ncbi:MAG: glycosyl transferase family 1 [Candidatus Sulfotelmatobacter sp.]|nr:glycosyl transferase family 1 [Candidatus Sulfotelmatobacter sp.]